MMMTKAADFLVAAADFLVAHPFCEVVLKRAGKFLTVEKKIATRYEISAEGLKKWNS